MGSGTDQIVIVGAGLTGLMAARLISTKLPAKNITIIESSASVGGNYRSVNYGEHGDFDQGMRMFYETGIEEYDRLIHAILPKDAWHIYRGNTKDIAGIYWNAALQTHSPYIDLRTLPKNILNSCKKEFAHILQSNAPLDHTNAQTYAVSRFGSTIASYVCDALSALYKQPANKLHVASMHQPTMDRVILYDAHELKPMLTNETIRARIAWPDQLTLPPLRACDQAALYPKQYGMHHAVNALKTQLLQSGVTIQLNDRLTTLNQKDGTIQSLKTQNGKTITNIKRLYWTASIQALAGLIKAPIPKTLQTSAPPVATMVHLLLPKKPEMGALYHCYNFNKELHTFRVTNYTNYCPNAHQSEGYPICMELWHLPASDTKTTAAHALRELLQLGIAQNTDNIAVCGVSTLPNTHIMCSLEHVSAIQTLKENIAKNIPNNAHLIGTFSNQHQMLLYEIWNDMYHRIMAHHG